MASDEFILAINPNPTNQGVRIEKVKYEIVRDAILENLRAFGPLKFTQLGDSWKISCKRNLPAR